MPNPRFLKQCIRETRQEYEPPRRPAPVIIVSGDSTNSPHSWQVMTRVPALPYIAFRNQAVVPALPNIAVRIDDTHGFDLTSDDEFASGSILTVPPRVIPSPRHSQGLSSGSDLPPLPADAYTPIQLITRLYTPVLRKPSINELIDFPDHFEKHRYDFENTLDTLTFGQKLFVRGLGLDEQLSNAKCWHALDRAVQKINSYINTLDDCKAKELWQSYHIFYLNDIMSIPPEEMHKKIKLISPKSGRT